MTRLTTTTIILSIIFLACSGKHSTPTDDTRQTHKSIDGIEIYLMPAFNNYSTLNINDSLNTVQFKVDQTERFYRTGIPAPFSISLDSFRINTLINSFYSQSFLDSIKHNPDELSNVDGLSIFTVIKQGSVSDTVNSSNVYPEILTANIISQIDYISKKTADTLLKNYIKDLRKYFH